MGENSPINFRYLSKTRRIAWSMKRVKRQVPLLLHSQGLRQFSFPFGMGGKGMECWRTVWFSSFSMIYHSLWPPREQKKWRGHGRGYKRKVRDAWRKRKTLLSEWKGDTDCRLQQCDQGLRKHNFLSEPPSILLNRLDFRLDRGNVLCRKTRKLVKNRYFMKMVLRIVE